MSEAKFLEWNKDNIFISLVQAEGHFRNLESGFAGKGEFLSCVSKHLAYAEGEAEEAVSHSLVVEGPIRSQEYAKLRNDLRDLRKKIQAGAVSPEEGIREVRKIRAMFERLNPPFDTSQCRSCGPAEDVLKRLSNLKDKEWEMAVRVLVDLSDKYGVEPPKLEISDNCHEPDEGHYKSGTITMCRGGVNLHVLLHEFKHYYDHTVGKSLDEGDAEAFAIETVEKGLYSPNAKHNHSDNKMNPAMKDVALVVGGVNMGWGVGYSAKAFLDPMAPGAIMGQDPSLLVDVGGTIAAIIGALRLRGEMAKKLSAYIAAGLSTHIWEDLAKALAPAAMVVTEAEAAAVGAPIGTRAVGETIPSMPAMPYPATRLAEYPFPSPVSIGGTMSPPHYTLNGVPGAPKTVALTPKYTLDTI